MSRIQADPFWDGKSGGGVRCSSEGDAASQYQDPSATFFEGNGGRSIASFLPGGLRGVVIPRATAFGGSRGFDPHKPRLVNIDPDIKGQSCVIDLSKITKESMDAAFEKASENPLAQQDIHLLAAQTFHNLAVSFEPVGIGPARGPKLVDRRPPLGDFGAYVVPKAGLGGGQITEEPVQEPILPQDLVSPSVSPRSAAAAFTQPRKKPVVNKVASAPPVQAEPVEAVYEPPIAAEPKQEEPRPMYEDQTPIQSRRPMRAVKLAGPPTAIPQATVVAPSTQVTFEMEGWGTLETLYHEVICNENLLVLVWDTKFKGGGKYFPPVVDRPIAVKINGIDNGFFVYSYGTRFQHAGYEYCMLIITQEFEIPDEA